MCFSTLTFTIILISILLVIVLIDTIINQRTTSEVLNKVSFGLLSDQVKTQCGETYRPLVDGTIFTLPDGSQFTVPNNSRLVETKTKLILQMGNGDLFTVPAGTRISIPIPNQPVPVPAPAPAPTPTEPAEEPTPDAEQPNDGTVDGGAEGFNSLDEVENFGSLEEVEKFNNKISDNQENYTLTDNYNDDLYNMAIDDGIKDSHFSFVSDITRVTNNAGKNIRRDDSQDVVPWRGLTRPDYAGVPTDFTTARQIPSHVSLDQLPEKSTFRF